MILDVLCCYLLFFLLYINIEIGNKMLNVRLAGDHQYGKLLFIWQSLVMALMVSYFVLPCSQEVSLVISGTELS